MTIRHWPGGERPREKLLERGAHALSDAELLALLLGSGIRGRSAVELARTLIAQFGSLRMLLNAEAARCLAQAPHEIRALVGGDATGDAEAYVLALHGSWSRSRNYRTLPREGRKPPCADAKWTHSERFLPLAARLRACLD